MKQKKNTSKNSVDQYTHKKSRRKNNPPVGLVDSKTDPDDQSAARQYKYDPRLDPQLQWSGKNENSEFEVDTVSLHVHERIDPHTILEKALKSDIKSQQTLQHFFDADENNPPLRNAIEFYKHDQNWSNRLIAGDSLLVMNSLLEKEGMAGKVQMIYIDPPYGIKYGSNFQPFINKKDVKDGKDDDLTQEPEMIKAFRDTWELGIHSYLSYLRNRFILCRKLLSESGSCFVQISDENVHFVRQLLNEIFGHKNFISEIVFAKTSGFTTSHLASTNDFLIWYAKDKSKMKYNSLFLSKEVGNGIKLYSHIELPNRTRRSLSKQEIENPNIIPKGRIFRVSDIQSQGEVKSDQKFKFKGIIYYPRNGAHWTTTIEGLGNLVKKHRITMKANIPQFVRYLDDYPVKKLTNIWDDTTTGGFNDKKIYSVQTATKVISRCILMTTDPGDLVLDITCGSGTTAYVAEKWGRRWVTCDTSRIAIALAKQRLMTSHFDYFKLLKPNEGVSSGFEYETVPHITLGSLANNEDPPVETLYDKPKIEKEKTRISGPFTVEAVPAPTVKSIDELSKENKNNKNLGLIRQQQWRDELLKTGIRGKSGQKIEFSTVQTHPATRWLHADAETKEDNPKRVMISFGPEYAPLEQRQVELAIEEARAQAQKPAMIIFAAMQFDPEAAKDIDELNWPGITILKAEMNKDLLTKDLKKKQSQNESFWLMGQPDVDVVSAEGGKYYIVRVNGFDYYDVASDEIISGGKSKIAMWMLDTDYDGRSVYPQQFFFPLDGDAGAGWSKLSKTLRSQIDTELITKYQGTESIPFEPGPNKRAAVKIIDDRGIESLKIVDLE